MPRRPFKGKINVDVRDSVPDWEPYMPPRAPEGSPNVLIVLYDDTGMAAWEPFGGRIRMPTLQRLADGGLRYSQWHTTALCSPTRSCMLTGRNHHQNGMACIVEGATGGARPCRGHQWARWPARAGRATVCRPPGRRTQWSGWHSQCGSSPRLCATARKACARRDSGGRSVSAAGQVAEETDALLAGLVLPPFGSVAVSSLLMALDVEGEVSASADLTASTKGTSCCLPR